MYKPVAKNKLQGRLNREIRQRLAPSPTEWLEIPCDIVKIYDPESEEDPPEAMQERREEAPGAIWALVEVAQGNQYFLPLDETPDQIYSTYGNSNILDGAPAKIRFRNQNIEFGSVFLIKRATEELLKMNESTTLADIGAIMGMGM